jgi:hypothetical protein
MLLIGTIIKCPKCEKELLKVAKPIHDGAIIKAEHLAKISYQPMDGNFMQCDTCGTYWFNAETGRVYTDKGWLS